MDNVFMEGLMAQPLWVKVWVGWMMLVNMASLAFIKRVEARWVLVAFMGGGIVMTLLAEVYGYNRLLGIGHVIFWTPVLAYLFFRRKQLDYDTAFGKWAVAIMITYAVSLIVDCIDVVRYTLGDTG